VKGLIVFPSVVITGMDEDDIKHIRDSTIITEFNLNEDGEVKDILSKVPNVVVI
jgi:hypothetical protein